MHLESIENPVESTLMGTRLSRAFLCMGSLMANEADTCRKFVVPKLQGAGWDTEPHVLSEQVTFTDGRILPLKSKIRRKPGKRADYILRYRPDFAIAVVEAKPTYKNATDGLQQAKDYAKILGLKFAYATNGKTIVEFDFLTGCETEVSDFPKPADLWSRLNVHVKLDHAASEQLLTPGFSLSGKHTRYYQEIAVNRVIESVLQGKRRILLTMATGTGKTFVAFQICWKLWSARWNRTGEPRRPKILYLADRNVLIDDPKDKTFAPFGEARWKIENGEANKGREMYFAIYQAIAKDERRHGLYKEYAPDFFDLIIVDECHRAAAMALIDDNEVDECHRGSANQESNWREILDYFEPAFQLGMTATPLREDNRDTYRLRQGIEDGFLAPYRVHRVVTTWDAAGWRPSQGDMDRFGRQIPDEEYQTNDFERVVALRARTEAVAKHLTEFLKKHDRYGKTIVFCVDQEHADEMRRALNNLNADLVQQHSDYVCRVTSDEGGIGRGHLSNFQDPERTSPVILTTSQMLTTGVDAPTCKNVVLVRVINSMTEFKQIIGRGTRVRTDYDKFFFNILDYTGSATRLFGDLDFDGEPALITEQAIDEVGNEEKPPVIIDIDDWDDEGSDDDGPVINDDPPPGERRKFYFDGGQVEIATHLVYDLDPNGKQLRVVEYRDYTAETVRTLCPTAVEIQKAWADPHLRADLIEKLEERGIDFDKLTDVTKQPDADPFDLLCHVAFNAPLRTRRERAKRLQSERKDFFDQYGPEARAVLNDLLDKYAEHGAAQFALPDVLQVPPISKYGNVVEIAARFGGEEKLAHAVHELQTMLYAA